MNNALLAYPLERALPSTQKCKGSVSSLSPNPMGFSLIMDTKLISPLVSYCEQLTQFVCNEVFVCFFFFKDFFFVVVFVSLFF